MEATQLISRDALLYNIILCCTLYFVCLDDHDGLLLVGSRLARVVVPLRDTEMVETDVIVSSAQVRKQSNFQLPNQI
jgi:hypothetical protein